MCNTRHVPIASLLTLLMSAAAFANERVEIDGRDLLIDGTPAIPHGMVHVGQEHLPRLKEIGIDTIHFDVAFRWYDPLASDEANRQRLQGAIKFADAAHANGQTILWLFSFHYTPGWLFERHPDARMLKYDGSAGSGGFMSMSLNHPGFRQAARQWLTFTAGHLGSHPATIGYVLWNEPHLQPPVDYNPHVITAFHKWLADRYESVRDLNEQWKTDYARYEDVASPPPVNAAKWSQYYDKMASEGRGQTFEVSGDAASVNRALWMDWIRFRQYNFAAYFKWEADVIRAADPDALITAKIVPFDLYTSHAYGAGVNTEMWVGQFLDVLGMDLYSHLDENFLARWKCDYFYSLSAGKPIWHTEFNFTFVKERGLATPEQWRTAFYYQLARGVNGFWDFMWGDDIEYTVHYKGYKFAPVTHEIARLGKDIAKLAPLLRGMKPTRAQVAVLHSTTTGLAVSGDHTPTADQTTVIDLLYRSHIPFRFITEDMVRSGGLNGYRVLIAVGVVALPDDVLETIRLWTVDNGGHVLANARFAQLDAYGRARAQHPPAWLGARVTQYHRRPREKTGTLSLSREARDVENKPVHVRIERNAYAARPITLSDGTVLGSGHIFGDEETQLAWSGRGRHEQFWEDLKILDDGQVIGRFDNHQPAIVATDQTVYLARDIGWVDDESHRMFRRFLRDCGVVNANSVTDIATGRPAPHVDLRMWEGGGKRVLFVINSAPTLHYDGHRVDVEVVFDAYGDVSDAITGQAVDSTWRDFKRVIAMRLEAGEVRVLLGHPYPGGWKHEQAKYDELLKHHQPDTSDYATFRRSPTELWVYDNRAELGVGMHGPSQAHIALARKLGMRFIRHTLYWYNVEKTTTPGVYDPGGLAGYDNTVRRAKENGIELLMIVHGNVPGTGWDNRRESYERFADFMAFAARRWPRVRYWELWNEMDVGFTNLFGAGRKGYPMFERGRCYAQMLKKVYPAIKQANPDAWIVVGGMSSYDGFIRGIYAEGGRDYFDIMNIHTYGVPVNWALYGRGYTARLAMGVYGEFDRPMWNTEFGIDAGNLAAVGNTTAEQFDQGHLGQWKTCIEQAKHHRIYAKILPYQFHAGNERGLDINAVKLPQGTSIDDYGFGVLRSDGKAPRPTYDWLLEAQVNRDVVERPTFTTDVSMPWDGTWMPVGHDYDTSDGRMTICDVTIDSIVPTVIQTQPAGE